MDDMVFTGSFFAMLLPMNSMHSCDLWNWRAEGEPYCVNKDVSFDYKCRKSNMSFLSEMRKNAS